MKYFLIAAAFGSLIMLSSACNNDSHSMASFQARLDSLQRQAKQAYAPGFGELMLNIQIHHAKLWFAGKNGNWALAAYDQSLIRSGFARIRKYHADNPSTAATDMISVPMDSIDAAIARKDAGSFKRSFGYLTTTCNNCHAVTHHEFNLITIPSSEPIGNQSYSIK